MLAENFQKWGCNPFWSGCLVLTVSLASSQSVDADAQCKRALTNLILRFGQLYRNIRSYQCWFIFCIYNWSVMKFIYFILFFRTLQVERVVAYEATTKEVTKWDPVVQEIRAVSVLSVCTFWDRFEVAIAVSWHIHIDGEGYGLRFGFQTHTTQAQTRNLASYFCVGQESMSVSGNVNEPLHNKDLPLGAIFSNKFVAFI